MNMIRNLLTVALFAFGICFYVLPEEDWKWVEAFGGQAVLGLGMLRSLQPFPSLVSCAIATALFMTRKQY